jgi:hypothetical protein
MATDHSGALPEPTAAEIAAAVVGLLAEVALRTQDQAVGRLGEGKLDRNCRRAWLP